MFQSKDDFQVHAKKKGKIEHDELKMSDLQLVENPKKFMKELDQLSYLLHNNPWDPKFLKREPRLARRWACGNLMHLHHLSFQSSQN